MSDDYLWDGTGEPDPDVERLERVLGPLRHSGAPPDPEQRPDPASPRLFLGLRPSTIAGVSIAAAILVSVALDPFLGSEEVIAPRPPVAAAASWRVKALEGDPRVGAEQCSPTGRLEVGQWLETDENSRAQVEVADIGTLDVAPRSRLRLVGTGPDEHRLELARGRISAEVIAPPRLFLVDTPSALAVDLGCAYTLDVSPRGDGVLHVTSGSVALESAGRESRVPADASCATRVGVGPGTPHFADAPKEWREALERFDFEGGAAADLDLVVADARPRDTLTLWHLIPRVGKEQRGAVFDRMIGFAAPPTGVTRTAAENLDEAALEAWWQQLWWEW